jgi:putative membrane protein
MLKPDDHQKVHDALEAAEARTSGEIFCIVAEESGAYREVPFAWAAGLTLALPPLALLIGLKPWNDLGGADWGEMSAPIDPMSLLLAYALIQGLLFAVSLLLMSLPPVRRFLTPSSVKRDRVHTRALEQFAHRLHATESETGVLIYASLAERRVEVIADEVIHAKVGDAAWDGAVAAALKAIKHGDVTGGLIAAVQSCGAVLALHCPAAPGGGPRVHGDILEI